MEAVGAIGEGRSNLFIGTLRNRAQYRAPFRSYGSSSYPPLLVDRDSGVPY